MFPSKTFLAALIGLNLAFSLPLVSAPPPAALTPEQQLKQQRTEWFHQAKYGIMFHFVPSMGRFKQIPWTSAAWNAKVDYVDVKKVAQQAADVGASYVIISLGQKGDYYCAPNPVYERYWGLKPGEFGSQRDLPMDLCLELKKRGIKMMLYLTAAPFASPGPASEKNGWHGKGRQFTRAETSLEGERRWLECLQRYSDHYGQAVAGWWVDWASSLRDTAKVFTRRCVMGIRRPSSPPRISRCRIFYTGTARENGKNSRSAFPRAGGWMKPTVSSGMRSNTWAAPGPRRERSIRRNLSSTTRPR